jgi:hypothetical protein
VISQKGPQRQDTDHGMTKTQVLPKRPVNVEVLQGSSGFVSVKMEFGEVV